MGRGRGRGPDPAAPGRPVWMTATRRLDLGLVFHCDRQPCSAQDGLGIGQFDERQAFRSGT